MIITRIPRRIGHFRTIELTPSVLIHTTIATNWPQSESSWSSWKWNYKWWLVGAPTQTCVCVCRLCSLSYNDRREKRVDTWRDERKWDHTVSQRSTFNLPEASTHFREIPPLLFFFLFKVWTGFVRPGNFLEPSTTIMNVDWLINNIRKRAPGRYGHHHHHRIDHFSDHRKSYPVLS